LFGSSSGISSQSTAKIKSPGFASASLIVSVPI
jgi:hypothetical protein